METAQEDAVSLMETTLSQMHAISGVVQDELLWRAVVMHSKAQVGSDPEVWGDGAAAPRPARAMVTAVAMNCILGECCAVLKKRGGVNVLFVMVVMIWKSVDAPKRKDVEVGLLYPKEAPNSCIYLCNIIHLVTILEIASSSLWLLSLCDAACLVVITRNSLSLQAQGYNGSVDKN